LLERALPLLEASQVGEPLLLREQRPRARGADEESLDPEGLVEDLERRRVTVAGPEMLDGRRQGGEERGGRRAPEPVRGQEDGVFPGRRAPLGPGVEPGTLRERAGERPLVLGAKG